MEKTIFLNEFFFLKKATTKKKQYTLILTNVAALGKSKNANNKKLFPRKKFHIYNRISSSVHFISI